MQQVVPNNVARAFGQALIRETNVQKCVPHVQHDQFFLFQPIILLPFDVAVAVAVLVP